MTTTDVIGGHRDLWPHLARYVPPQDARVLVVGPGRGLFERAFLAQHTDVWLVDQSEEWLRASTCRPGWKAIRSRAEDLLASDYPQGVRWAMLSHVLEHLAPADVYAVLRRLDTVMLPGSRLVLACPTPWWHFYADLSHVRPYLPEVFLRYLCAMTCDHGRPAVSQAYRPLWLGYSWADVDGQEDRAAELWQASGWAGRAYLRLVEWWRRALGLRRYRRSSWALVLEKGA